MRLGKWFEGVHSIDLHDLTLSDAGSWSVQVKALFALALGVMLLSGGYFLVVQPSLNRLEAHRDIETTLMTELVGRSQQAANLKTYGEQVSELETLLGSRVGQLPLESEVSGLLEDISRLGLAAGLVFENIQWLPEVMQPFYMELPLQITVVGDYHDFGVFASGVAGLPRIVTLHDFAIETLELVADGKLRMNLQARIYRSRERSLTP